MLKKGVRTRSCEQISTQKNTRTRAMVQTLQLRAILAALTITLAALHHLQQCLKIRAYRLPPISDSTLISNVYGFIITCGPRPEFPGWKSTVET